MVVAQDKPTSNMTETTKQFIILFIVFVAAPLYTLWCVLRDDRKDQP